MNNKKAILVLSTGGARGLAHIGAIEELEKHGFEITAVIGSSMGALVGAMFATGTMKECKEWLCNLNKRKLFRLADFTFSKEGIIKGDRILEMLRKLIPDCDIENLPVAYSAVATDIETEQEVVFKKGSLHNAIRASISIPMLFHPLKVGGMSLIDGGIGNPLPLNQAERREAELVIAVNVNAPNPAPEKPGKRKNSYYKLLTESSRIMQQQIIRYSIEKYRPDIVVEIPGQSFDMLDFHKASEIIELGREAMKIALLPLSASRESTD